jgi:hypothetical protein
VCKPRIGGQGIAGRLDRIPAGSAPLLPYDGDQFLDAADVEDSVEMVDQNGETHVSSPFCESPRQQISLVPPALARANGMCHQAFP